MPKRKTAPKRKPAPKRRPKPQPTRLPDELRTVALTAEIGPDDWVDLQAAEGDDTPRVARFTTTAYTGGIMRPNISIPVYGRGVVLDLAGFRSVPGQVPIDYFHRNEDPIGHCDRVEYGNSIRAEGVLSVPGESRDKVVQAARDGFRWKTSVDVSADADAVERIPPDQLVTVNGRSLRGPFLLFRRGTVRAITFLTVAGDPNASASVRAALVSDPGTDSMNFEAWLKACGLESADLTDEQTVTLRAAYDAQFGEGDGDGDGEGEGEGVQTPVRAGAANPSPGTGSAPQGGNAPQHPPAGDPVTLRAAANQERIERIVSICAAANSPTIEVDGTEVSLSAHAIRHDWSADATELHILRTTRQTGPAVHSHSRGDTVNVQAMQGAVLLASGIALDNPIFGDQSAAAVGVPAFLRAGLNDANRNRLMDAAHRLGAVNLLDMAQDCIEQETGIRHRDRETLIRAAASSANLHEVYSATVGASLLVGYRESARTLERWTSVDEVDDFKAVQRFRDDSEEPLDYLPPGGEAGHATAGAKFETLAVDSYAKQYEITRHDYINNNLGLLSRKPRKMGEAAYKTEENLGYATLASNPTMNSTGRALFNSTDGTLFVTSPLNRANASVLIAAMANQMDGDETIDLMARFALVPTELSDLAVQVFRSPTLGEDGGQGNINPVARHGIQPIPVPRLSNGVRHPKTKTFYAGSDSTYYIVGEGTEGPVRVYLRGSGRAPMVRVTQLTQGKWGTHIDVIHDVGFGFVSTKPVFKVTA